MLAAMFVVLVLTMLGVGVVTDAVFMNRQINDMETRLNAAAEHAQTLAQEPITPEELVEHLARGNMHAVVRTADGKIVGDPRPPERTRYVTDFPLNAHGSLRGVEVTVWESTDSVVGARRSLDASLLLVGVLGIVGASLLTVVITDVALKPLEVMADRANRIKEGERGIRMAAPHETSEVGRTAAAIDGMLDELEGAEIRARAAEAQARASTEQMQGFLSDAAHELKTPMAGIQAAAESLIQLPEDATEEREQLAFLLGREANRGGHLVNSLLEAARVDAGPRLSLEVLDLGDLALAEQRRMSLVHPKLEVLVQGANQLVRADRQAMTSVLRNLVDNAARAAGPEGWIVIDLGTGQRNGTEMAVLRVVDSGPGIPEEDRERVFDRLVRLSSTATTTKGSGLGLPIARGYARAHGGEVVYVADAAGLPPHEDGEPRQPGACFEVSLPLARKASAPVNRRQEATA
ncbi:HAMP domain-containing sensor histidine kinase [Luteococcus sp. H101]